MKRNQWITIHLMLVGLFFPFLIILPLSGTGYLLGVKGTMTKTDAFTVDYPFIKDAEGIRKIFAQKKINFDFEYVKDRGDHIVLRPSTRTHYEVYPTETGMLFKKAEPSLMKAMQELHFGHGPGWVKKLETAFGIAFLLVVFSGFMLSLNLKKLLKPFLIASAISSLLVILAFF